MRNMSFNRAHGAGFFLMGKGMEKGGRGRRRLASGYRRRQMRYRWGGGRERRGEGRREGEGETGVRGKERTEISRPSSVF